MNVLKSLCMAMAVFISSAALANEPQLILINTPKKIATVEKEENLQKFEINNDELVYLSSFTPAKKFASK